MSRACVEVTWVGVVLAFAVCAPRVAAQTATCDPTKSAQACFTLLRDGNVAAHLNADSAAVDSVGAKLSAKATGSEASVLGAESAIKDFLPRLVTALGIPGLSVDPGAIDVRFNVKPNDPVWRAPFSLQLGAKANQPALFDPLTANVPSDQRSSVADSVTKTLDDFADVTFTGAFNLESASWGRSFRTHAAEISALTATLLGSNDAEVNAVNAELASKVAHLAVVDPARCTAATAKINMPLNCFSPDDRGAVEALLLRLDRTVSEVEARDQELLKRAHFDQLDELLNNQPQLSLTANYQARRQEVGPDRYTASLRFEFSPVNLNAARAYCHDQGSSGLEAPCVEKYLDQPEIQAAITRADRLWVSADVSKVEAYDFALAADTAAVVQAKSVLVEPAVGYGRYLRTGSSELRMDAELRYRYSNNTNVVENRWVAAVTLTQKITAQSSTILTLKWANKPEYLGAVDKKLRANIGLSYKLPGS